MTHTSYFEICGALKRWLIEVKCGTLKPWIGKNGNMRDVDQIGDRQS